MLRVTEPEVYDPRPLILAWAVGGFIVLVVVLVLVSVWSSNLVRKAKAKAEQAEEADRRALR